MTPIEDDLDAWSQRLHPARIDLVGDYAGQELFFIEGDSLLRLAFSDGRIDMDNGFQLLHAVYAVECFLANLKKRKCNFHLVFFEEHSYFCVPSRASKASGHNYLFARSAVIRHLVSVAESPRVPAEDPFRVFQFQSAADAGFQAYLETTRPYFAMSQHGEAGLKGKALRFLMKGFVWRMVTAGYSVALLGGVEFRDSKVMATVVQGGPKVGFTASQLQQRSRQIYTKLLRMHKPDVQDYGFPSIPAGAVSSERELMAVASVSAIIKGSGMDAVEISHAAVFVLHVALLNHLSLPQRRLDCTQPASTGIGSSRAFGWIIAVSRSFLQSGDYQHAAAQLKSDIHDYVDGRLLGELRSRIESGCFRFELLPGPVLDDFVRMAGAIKVASGHTLALPSRTHRGPLPSPPSSSGPRNLPQPEDTRLAVLPFSNPTFDVFLSQIKLAIDTSPAALEVDGRNRRFQESAQLSGGMTLGDRAPEVLLAPVRQSVPKWKVGLRLKKNQLAVARMRKYAASLVGVRGKMLEPVVVTNNPTQQLAVKAPSAAKVSGKEKKGKAKAVSKKDDIRAENNRKLSEKGDVALQRTWKTLHRDLQTITDDEARILKLDQFLDSFDSPLSDKGCVVEAEVKLYKIWMLQRIWAGFCRADARSGGHQVAAMIFDEARRVVHSKGLTNTAHGILKNLFQALGVSMPPRGSSGPLLDGKLSFSTTWDGTSVADIGLRMTLTEFQLRCCGHYMDRDMDSKPDPRVSFEPDGWQRKVLDEIDRNNSVFVVAPTSAGKTFISFYAMEKVLRSGDEGVLVYIAPTKALVNQIAAEIMARFRKAYAHAGTSVWAVHTRGAQINSPTGCQILVTVPHILQIMLLSPKNANSWSTRVKRIIFDEIHCIGQAEDGVVWEQLLLLAPCPIIALSATVGNPGEFSSWMRSTQMSQGIKLTMVQHQHRYADLRKFFYTHSGAYRFTGLKTNSRFTRLEGTSCFVPMHPIASLVNSSRGMPEDLALEPSDCLSLYRALKKHSTGEYQVKNNLDPEIFFAQCPVIHKVDMIKWEEELKAVLQHWMKVSGSPFDRIIRELGSQLVENPTSTDDEDPRSDTEQESADKDLQSERAVEEAAEIASNLATLLKSTLPLLDELNSKNALPAILFSYDRAICEKLCFNILQQLEEAEGLWKKTSPEWATTIRKWTEHNEAKNSRAAKKQAKSTARNLEGTKEERMRELVAEGSSFLDYFNPKDPLPQFSFADKSKCSQEELDEELRILAKIHLLPSYLVRALGRGIGVHHTGLSRIYLYTVEMLFRRGYLRAVIATGTLSLGINMPCKTVVFAGDSVWLTALNFRQASGRAGRRGFDNLGNVVFLGVSANKARFLMSSKLPSLMGHFPITTSLVLRLFNLLHDSNGSEHAKRAISGLLSQPRLYLGGESFKEQVLHHLRFSIEYLRRQNLLGPGGETLHFAGIASHLYYTENSSFAFHALLRAGFFHSICADFDTKPRQTCMTIMFVMAHLFGRLFCWGADPVNKLRPLPSRATAILEKQNDEALQIYTNYVKTFAAEHCGSTADNVLPFSNQVCGQSLAEVSLENIPITPLPPVIARSSFVALSGFGDTFASISDLTDSVRAGIFLERAAVPHLPIGKETTLNSYLLDFYRHGEVATLIRQNRIRRSDIWFALDEFNLILGTIVNSLASSMACEDDEGTFDAAELGDMDELDADDQGYGTGDSEEESDLGGSSEDDDEVEPLMTQAGSVKVLRAFDMLRRGFYEKFRNMWA